MMQPTLLLTGVFFVVKSVPSGLPEAQCWAALDLGSNSFRLLLAEPAGSSFRVIERMKHKVQLLAGLREGQIAADAQRRGLACLARFAQRLRPVPLEQVQVMGTYALRQADNAAQFAAAAQALLGVPVEIISGEREAQLVYTAVTHHVGPDPHGRMVIDIGGGSTEVALGAGVAAQYAMSVNVGCVAFNEQFFADGVSAASYHRAKAAAAQAFAEHLAAGALPSWPSGGWPHRVFGTSGTIESIHTVLNANGWARDVITREALDRLETAITEEHWVIHAGLPGLSPDRVDIFPAGVAILSACFAALKIERCEFVDVSLGQGMVCERVVTNLEADIQQDSVDGLAHRFKVDPAQAARVRQTALTLFDASDDWWSAGQREAYRALLGWAAQLHELGVHISARHYHRHGAYIVKHADLPAFSEAQQSMLALLIRGHRRSMPGLAFRAFDPLQARQLLRLVVLLRLAVILQRSHDDRETPDLCLNITASGVELDCGHGWLKAHPLSLKELQVEQQQLAGAGIELVLRHAPPT